MKKMGRRAGSALVLVLAFCGSSYAQADRPSPSPVPANPLENQIESVYSAASPSVVNITSRTVSYDFFLQAVPQEGTGSGFIYDRQGDIVTNFHVVEGADSITVTFASGQTYRAGVVGSDPSSDLAVIRVRSPHLPRPLAIGNAGALRVGQFVVALGNPFGLARTLTFGVISALGRVIQSPNGRFIGEAIQTDTPINPGNSGGPLLDLGGNVIGVTSQILSPSGVNAGIGFAVSASTVRRVVPQLIATGRYAHPYLGIDSIDLNPELTQALTQAGFPVPEKGLLVVSVPPDTPAARAGIRGGDTTVDIGNELVQLGGDVITAINGNPVTTLSDLTVLLEDTTHVGDQIVIGLMRKGRPLKVKAILGERPQSS